MNDLVSCLSFYGQDVLSTPLLHESIKLNTKLNIVFLSSIYARLLHMIPVHKKIDRPTIFFRNVTGNAGIFLLAL